MGAQKNRGHTCFDELLFHSLIYVKKLKKSIVLTLLNKLQKKVNVPRGILESI